jgi:beta-glucosidase
MESGEGTDRATLNMSGVQEELLKKIVAVGKPVVLVTIEGRPLTIDWAADHVPAIVEAFYPGEEGGNAIADVLFGAYNPAGRLPLSMPRNVGQLPVFYGNVRPDYVDSPGTPLFAFGYGLSYTTFSYDHLVIVPDEKEMGADVSVEISNTGKMSGDEVAQLYLREEVATVERPSKLLKGFQRLHLDPGVKQTAHFHLSPPDLAVFGQESKWMVEAGTFDVMIGGSSSDIRQQGKFSISKSRVLDDYPHDH